MAVRCGCCRKEGVQEEVQEGVLVQVLNEIFLTKCNWHKNMSLMFIDWLSPCSVVDPIYSLSTNH